MNSQHTPLNGSSPPQDPNLLQKKGKDFFDISEREWWWRCTIKNTPIPGTYKTKTFIDELTAQPISKSYGFKSEGRKKNADPSRKGHYLMPGLYERKDDIVDELGRKKMTYNFVAVDRNNTSAVTSGMMDKVIQRSQVGPTTYDPGYKQVPKLPVRHPVFKSQSRRFPTIHFKPKEGPAPGQYETFKESEVNTCLKATAPFKSKTPRFIKQHIQKTPGPGSYTRMNQMPMPPHVRSLGRYHGLFFPPGVY